MRFPTPVAKLALAALLVACTPLAAAQGPTAKPLRVVVPASPGSAIDAPVRVIGHEMTARTGRAVVIENVPGAAGNIASAQAARAAPDGNTLLVQIMSFVVNPSLFKKVPYDPIRDFQPVILSTWGAGLMLVINPALKGVDSLKALISLSRSKPGQLNYASPGIGSPNHLAMELFKKLSGADLTHVPYKTPASMVSAVSSGDVATIFSSATVAIPQIRAGKYKVLAVAGRERSPHAPDAPTMAEAGFPEFRVDIWMGFLAPSGTPGDIIRRLNADLAASQGAAATKEALSKLGLIAATSTPEEFAEIIRGDLAYWAKVIRDTGISID